MDRERWEAYEREHTPNNLEEGVELVLSYLEAAINGTAAQVAGPPAEECLLSPSPPAEGECLLSPCPPAEGECLLVLPPQPKREAQKNKEVKDWEEECRLRARHPWRFNKPSPGCLLCDQDHLFANCPFHCPYQEGEGELAQEKVRRRKQRGGKVRRKQREPRWCTMCIAYGHEDEDCPEQEQEDEEPECPAPEWEEPKRPAPEWEEPKRPAPEWEEPEHPAPEWEEPERPKPKREESCVHSPRGRSREESVRPQPKEGGFGASIAQEGEICASTALGPKLPAEGECLLSPSPPAEGEFLLVLPPPPWEVYTPLPPLLPGDYTPLPPPLAGAEQQELPLPLPPSPAEDYTPLPPPPVGAEQQELPLPPPPPRREQSSRSCLCLRHLHQQKVNACWVPVHQQRVNACWVPVHQQRMNSCWYHFPNQQRRNACW
ncbi:UNVERIFIED_CONTAM: hypothetical protein FKN15_053605 [Acipenser sinensis]